MPKPPEEILAALDERRQQRSPLLARCEELTRAYNGDLAFPLPELDDNERQMVANLVQGGIDQTAMRIASTVPTVHFPPSRPGRKASQDRARKKRDVILGWWDENRYTLKARRRARWLIGYAAAPVRIDVLARLPQWRLVSPLGCFPAPCLDPDEIVPPDAINVYVRSREWLERRYPDQMRVLRKGDQRTFEVIEYVDANEVVWLVRGSKEQETVYTQRRTGDGVSEVEELVRVPNRADRPLVIVPGRVTLDRPLGQYDGAIGLMHTKSMLMALAVIAQKRAIFPEEWVVSGTNSGRPEIIQEAEPMSGQIGIIQNGSVQFVRPETSVFTSQVLDRLEYEMRGDAFIPSQYSGYNPTNVRTGRAGAQLLEAVIDFPIQEAQEILAIAAEEENKAAIAVAKAYQSGKPISMYVKGRGEITYIPRETFDSDVHEVHFPMPGADARGMEIAIGQKIGMGILSKRTAMELDPSIRDPESELDRITVEKVNDAWDAQIQTLASNPDGPWQPEDFARYTELIVSDKKERYEAAQIVIQEVKERQLAQQQAAVSEVEQMPGLAQPGAPGAPVPSIGPPPESMSNLSRALAQLRVPAMRLRGEQAVTQ